MARLRELDLIEAVAELAQVATGGQPLVASLERIVTLELSAVPGADGAAVTMADQQQSRTTVVSDHVVRRVHDIADTLREAPWVTAMAGGATQTSGELDVDIRWPRFGPRVRALGIHSVLAAPLVFGGEVLGTLDLLARGRDVFDAHARTIGETSPWPPRSPSSTPAGRSGPSCSPSSCRPH